MIKKYQKRIIFINLILSLILVSCSMNKENARIIEFNEMYFQGSIEEFNSEQYDSTNYPNPFSPPTKYTFEVINKRDSVTVNFLDINSKLISSVFSGRLEPNIYEINEIESNLNNGIYLLQISINDSTINHNYLHSNFTENKKIIKIILKNGKSMTGNIVSLKNGILYVAYQRILFEINYKNVIEITQNGSDFSSNLKEYKDKKIKYNKYSEFNKFE